MSEANKTQVGGQHYKMPIEHWDIVALWGLDYFQGQITKYVMRWREKGGIQDLEKSIHFTQKYIEVEKARAAGTLTAKLLGDAYGGVDDQDAEDGHSPYQHNDSHQRREPTLGNGPADRLPHGGTRTV